MSAKQRSESEDTGNSGNSAKRSASRPARKQRSADLGRALRSVYDDTLRESVPDEFVSLLGKLQ